MDLYYLPELHVCFTSQGYLAKQTTEYLYIVTSVT